MDLSVDIAGVKLKSPIISASSVDGMDGERIGLVSEFKLGAATTKTIVKNMQVDVLPNMKMVRGGSMINCVFGANLTAEQWFDNEFPKARAAGIPIIANMAGVTPEEAAELAKKCQDAGAAFIELPTACPHMANVLEAMYPGLEMPLPEVDDPKEYAMTVAAVRKAVSIPIISKFSAIFHLNSKVWARASVDAGADAIAAADSLGPVMGINIEDGQPILGGPRGYGGLTGAALKPLVLRMVLEITEEVDVPVIGIGGISSGAEAVEYIMAGASAVALSSASILNGYELYADVYDELAAFMKRKGYSSLKDFRGLTHQRIRERLDKKQQILHEILVPTRSKSKCVGCSNCVMACAYGAIEMGSGNKAELIKDECVGCGLCVSVCTKGAIEHDYYS